MLIVLTLALNCEQPGACYSAPTEQTLLPRRTDSTRSRVYRSPVRMSAIPFIFNRMIYGRSMQCHGQQWSNI